MINSVALVGRLTRDPELRRTQQGDAVTSFTLAVNRNYTAKDGQQQADFINCVVWRKQAENVERYCSKGSMVGVEGRLQSRSYDNAQGQKVFVTEVFCSSVQFIGLGQKSQPQPQNNAIDNTFNNTQQFDPYEFMQQGTGTEEHFLINEDDIQF